MNEPAAGDRDGLHCEAPVSGFDPGGEHVVAIAPFISSPGERLMALAGRFRRQIVNLTAFTFLQAASYLIPVVTIPYFARTLGIAGMGVLAIAGAVALAAGVIMDYAIQLSGTRFAAAHADDYPAINSYLNVTTLVKIGLFFPMLLGLIASTMFAEQVATHFWIFFWSLVSAATMCLFPQWLFQGLLVMPVAARILVSCRVAAAVIGMIFVRGPADAFIVPMAQAMGGFIALLTASVAMKRRYGIVPGLVAAGQARRLLSENWTLFSATAWGAAYAHGGIIIMSTMLSSTSIGFYSIAQKISQAFVSMFNVAAQTGFPSFVRSHQRDVMIFARQIRLYMALVVTASAAALFVLFLAREPLYTFFAGRHDATGVTVFVLWLVASLFTITSVSLNPVMVVLRRDGAMARFYRLTGLLFLACAPVACHFFGVIGMASAMLATEGLMALFFAASVWQGLRHSPGVESC